MAVGTRVGITLPRGEGNGNPNDGGAWQATYRPWGHGRVRRDLSTEKQQHPPCEVNMVENTEALIRIEEVKHRPS